MFIQVLTTRLFCRAYDLLSSLLKRYIFSILLSCIVLLSNNNNVSSLVSMLVNFILELSIYIITNVCSCNFSFDGESICIISFNCKYNSLLVSDIILYL